MPSSAPRDGAAGCSLFMLTCALLMMSSHSKATAYQCLQITDAKYCYIEHFKQQCMKSCGACSSGCGIGAQPEQQPETYGDYGGTNLVTTTAATTTTPVCFKLGQACDQPLGTPAEDVVSCCDNTVCTPVYDALGISYPTCLLPSKAQVSVKSRKSPF